MTNEADFRLVDAMPDAELIQGVLVPTEFVSDAHADFQGFLLTILRAYVGHHRLGKVLGSRTAVRLDTTEVYEPDILFVAAERTEIVKHAGVFGAPDLVIELLSPSTASLDWGTKRRVYAQSGVRELWLVDPSGLAGSAFFQRDPTGLKEVGLEDDVLRSVTVPGFFVRAEWLWPASGELPSVVSVLKELGLKARHGTIDC